MRCADFMRIGGVIGWLGAAQLPEPGVLMSRHLYPEVAAHAMRITWTAHGLERQDWSDPKSNDVPREVDVIAMSSGSTFGDAWNAGTTTIRGRDVPARSRAV